MRRARRAPSPHPSRQTRDAPRRIERLLVTRDQDLMEEVGTRVWHFTGHGEILDFKGSYEEFASTPV
ncbi:MAG: hypothetical protein AB7I50_19390 [Vicinamibacterales bacterium]